VSRVVRKQTRIGPLTIPCPLVHKLGRQASFQHVDDVLAQHGEELEAVEVTAGGNVEALGRGVRRDDEVGAGGKGVPVMLISVLDILLCPLIVTYQQMRCFSILKSAPFLP